MHSELITKSCHIEGDANIETLLRDLEAIEVGTPIKDTRPGPKGKQIISGLQGTYHAKDTTVRITYDEHTGLDIESTGRKYLVDKVLKIISDVFNP